MAYTDIASREVSQSAINYNIVCNTRYQVGAGVIPFTVRGNGVSFLFQTTFSGRKVGHLIDFGGGLGPGEGYRETAVREFVEETETMYFSDNVQHASRSVESVKQQIPIVAAVFEQTLATHPDWWCQRAPGNPTRPKQWRTFFIEFPYRDVEEMNRAWAEDQVGRFKKRRELVWVPADELLAIYANAPDMLWKRVRQLENATDTVNSILRSKTL